MDKWQEEVMGSLLDSEEEALAELEKEYKQALSDINQQIRLFQSDINMIDEALNAGGLSDSQTEILLSQRRSKVYQQQFQQALQGQVNGILDQLHSKEYATIDKYLHDCYENSYVGEFYSLSQQGLPYIAPINQSAATHAILTDSKVVRGYYDRLGVDTDHLKDVISHEITRGIASALSYADIARNINNASRSGLYNAQRIARTEGHRIQNTAARDAANNAVAHGADLVKIWDATLDGKTRESHIAVDGEIRELDEKFSNGLDRPGDPSGSAEEVINCRCHEIHKPRWAVQDGFVKMDNFTGELRTFNSPEDYAQFKEWYFSKENMEYMSYVQQLEDKYGTRDFEKLFFQLSDAEHKHLRNLESLSPLFLKSSGQFGDKAIPYSQRNIDIGSRLRTYLKELKENGQYIILSDNSFNLSDLAVLTTETGVEFTKITIDGMSYLIRGAEKETYIPENIISELIARHGTLDAHTHPFIGDLLPSASDIEALKRLSWQTESVIIDPVGNAITFDIKGNTDSLEIEDIRDENYYASMIWD